MYPKLVELGPITIHSYGLLLATAYLSAIWMAAVLGAREGLPKQKIWDVGFVIIISALIGAKLLMVVVDLGDYLSQPSRFLTLEFWQAGGVYYGGLMGATLGSAIYIFRHPEIRFWKVADAAAPGIALGQSIGRLGCFAAGCDYGRPADLPWAVRFTSEYAHRYVGVPLDVPLHPYQLYESGAAFLILLGLLWAYGKKRFPGQVFCLYLMVYGVARFILEFYRGDVDRGFLFGGWLSTSQFISLLIVPLGLAGYWILKWRDTAVARR